MTQQARRGVGRIAPDVGVCVRQAIGAGFDARPHDERRVAELKAGTLRMYPHPTWDMPAVLRWDEDPFGQRNWRAQLHMLRWVDPLRRAGLAGDLEAAEIWWHHVGSWLRTDHSGWANWAWRDMVDGIRAQSLVVGFPLVPKSARLFYLDVVENHGTWLADPKHRAKANHGLHQLIGLLIVGAFLRRSDWVDQARREMGAYLQSEYDDEGVNREGAIEYHLLNRSWWRRALQRLELEGVPPLPETGSLERAETALVHSTRPDGRLEVVGDTEHKLLPDLGTPESSWVASGGSIGSPPPAVYSHLKSGYVFGRSGWGIGDANLKDETFYSVLAGGAGRPHGHDDAGAVTYYSKGVPWLVDPGKFSYNYSDPMRQHLISRTAHNVVEVEGGMRQDGLPARIVRAESSSEIDDTLLLDGGYRSISVQRRLVFQRPGGFLLVIDTLRATREIEAVQRWQVGVGVKASKFLRGVRLAQGERTAHLQWVARSPRVSFHRGEKQPHRGWVSPRWMESHAATQVAARTTGKLIQFITLISSGGALEVKEFQRLPSASLALRVNVGQEEHSVTVLPDRAFVGFIIA